jgi:hypothetical protein
LQFFCRRVIPSDVTSRNQAERKESLVGHHSTFERFATEDFTSYLDKPSSCKTRANSSHLYNGFGFVLSQKVGEMSFLFNSELKATVPATHFHAPDLLSR